MNITFKVPTIACEVCAKTITKAIQNLDHNAEVKVDVAEKIVTVTTEKTADNVKEAIIDAGHEIAE
jgi:copper chaperone